MVVGPGLGVDGAGPLGSAGRGQQGPVQGHQKLAAPHVAQKFFQGRGRRGVAGPQRVRKPGRLNLGVARRGEAKGCVEGGELPGPNGGRQAVEEVNPLVAAPAGRGGG